MFNLKSWKLWIVTVLILGIFFRFVNIDKKVYWFDEMATSVRISGYTWAEMEQELGIGKNEIYQPAKEIGIEDLQKYQRLNPEKTIVDTVKGLALEEPQLTPLYFIIIRLWAECFGDSIATIRSLSALLSLIIFPCVYWLCLELFESPLVGWIAISLIAVSPYQLLYAQEARPYMLWMVTILLSTLALIRAIKLKTKLSWSIYTGIAILGIYSHAFFALVVISHGISVLAIDDWRWSKTVMNYLLASLVAMTAFLPWVYVIIAGFYKVMLTTNLGNNAGRSSGLINSHLIPILKWGVNLSANFIDADKDRKIINLGFDNLLAYLIQSLVVLIILALVAYSIYFLWRNASKQASLLILPLIGLPALVLIVPDLIFGSKLSQSIARYFSPGFLAIQIVVAYLFATKITSISTNIRQKMLGNIVFLLLLSCGILSCAVIAQTPSWWTKNDSYHDFKMSQIINQSPHPLIVCGGFDASIKCIYLSYLIKPEVRFQLVVESNIPRISDRFSDVFLFRPSDDILEKMQKQQNYNIDPIYHYRKMWIGRNESKILLWRIEKY